MDFYFIQALTEDGCFQQYLYRIGRVDTEIYTYCGGVDTPEHIFYLCEKWVPPRITLK